MGGTIPAFVNDRASGTEKCQTHKWLFRVWPSKGGPPYDVGAADALGRREPSFPNDLVEALARNAGRVELDYSDAVGERNLSGSNAVFSG